MLTETSAALFTATTQRVYFKSIDILLPSTWTVPIPGITPTLTRAYFFKW